MTLPKEISGRWSFSGGSNIFSLEEIVPSGESAFTANLTWWTRDPACVVRNQSITGRITATGIAFDGKTKCDVKFVAELNRSEGVWTGRATTEQGTVVEMKAK